ncbi:hypothetical protein TNCV_442141 [Trichonephila clavipes]|nr:hypothetical protein TNCV_442141 [Trichonephila clavipes]
MSFNCQRKFKILLLVQYDASTALLWIRRNSSQLWTMHVRTSISLRQNALETNASLVYADKPQTFDNLEDNIRRVIADIRPQMLEKVIENWTSRLDYIRVSRGSPMPEIIFKMFDKMTTKSGDTVVLLSFRAERARKRSPTGVVIRGQFETSILDIEFFYLSRLQSLHDFSRYIDV